jgi:hypothetical protein
MFSRAYCVVPFKKIPSFSASSSSHLGSPKSGIHPWRVGSTTLRKGLKKKTGVVIPRWRIFDDETA